MDDWAKVLVETAFDPDALALLAGVVVSPLGTLIHGPGFVGWLYITSRKALATDVDILSKVKDSGVDGERIEALRRHVGVAILVIYGDGDGSGPGGGSPGRWNGRRLLLLAFGVLHAALWVGIGARFAEASRWGWLVGLPALFGAWVTARAVDLRVPIAPFMGASQERDQGRGRQQVQAGASADHGR